MGVQWLLGLVLVLVLAGLFFAVLGLAWHVGRWLASSVSRLISGSAELHGDAPPGGSEAGMGRGGAPSQGWCPNDKCRNHNLPGARFCARCGRPLAAGGAAGDSVSTG